MAPVFTLSLLLTQLVVILAVAHIFGRAVRAIGQPRVVGEMLAGLALGPSVLGLAAPGTMRVLFPQDRMVALATLGQFGVILFMFVVGLRLDVSLLKGPRPPRRRHQPREHLRAVRSWRVRWQLAVPGFGWRQSGAAAVRTFLRRSDERDGVPCARQNS